MHVNPHQIANLNNLTVSPTWIIWDEVELWGHIRWDEETYIWSLTWNFMRTHKIHITMWGHECLVVWILEHWWSLMLWIESLTWVGYIWNVSYIKKILTAELRLSTCLKAKTTESWMDRIWSLWDLVYTVGHFSSVVWIIKHGFHIKTECSTIFLIQFR